MRLTLLAGSLLLAASVSLMTYLESWFQNWAGNRADSANILNVALGDSRRLFATHFYVKADAYLHSGYYPTIYDTRSPSERTHLAGGTGMAPGQHEEGSDFLGPPKDWLDAFSRHFYPSTHRHLGEGSEAGHPHEGEADHDDHDKKHSGEEREILPWLSLAANLDPERPETYLVASFWLRSRLGKIDDAEHFLREGLQANPGNFEILLELGHIYSDDRKNPVRARNAWELGLRNWREKEAGKPDPNIFAYAQILGSLATLEQAQQNYAKAIEYLTLLQGVSPHKDSIQQWINDLKTKVGKE